MLVNALSNTALYELAGAHMHMYDFILTSKMHKSLFKFVTMISWQVY